MILTSTNTRRARILYTLLRHHPTIRTARLVHTNNVFESVSLGFDLYSACHFKGDAAQPMLRHRADIDSVRAMFKPRIVTCDQPRHREQLYIRYINGVCIRKNAQTLESDAKNIYNANCWVRALWFVWFIYKAQWMVN